MLYNSIFIIYVIEIDIFTNKIGFIYMVYVKPGYEQLQYKHFYK